VKIQIQIILLSIFLLIFGCKENTEVQKTDKSENQIESKKLLIDSIEKKSKKPKHFEHRYVEARSGLNYRDLPNGKVLGKFTLNTHLKIIEHTQVFSELKDGGDTIKGEWVGVEKNLDTVYVFSGFLSNSYTYSNIKLFQASPYFKSEKETSNGFVNISEIYPFDYENYSNTIIPEEKLGKEPIKFSKIQTNKILNKISVSKQDTLYIINLDKDSIYKIPIKDLNAIAYLNPYIDYATKEYEYMIGFDLKEYYKENGENFVHIGRTNPFQLGNIKPMVWAKIDNKNFPIKPDIIDENITLETYTLSLSNFRFFIQSYRFHKKNRNWIRRHHLIVIEKSSDTIISEFNYHSSEGIDLRSIDTSKIEREYYYSWTGELFKGKPPIIYGLYSNSFGCKSIDFIYKSEPPIPILCDNRH